MTLKQNDSSSPSQYPQAWSQSEPQILRDLAVSSEDGLNDHEAALRQRRYGLNQLREVKPRSVFKIFINQVKSLVVLLLVAASIVSISFGELVQGLAVIVVIIINTAIGFITEWRAIRSMEALRQLGQINANVRRNGQLRQILARDIVPGDIVVFEGGEVISSDIRILQASSLQADESVLTGESRPQSKQTDPLAVDCHLSERTNMLHKGTTLTRGNGEGVVVATGVHTQLGLVSKLVSGADSKSTPLEIKLAGLARQLIYFTLLITGLIAIAGVYMGRDTLLSIEIAIALAVAAIPEGLPIVATIALANGLHKLAKRHALINRLSAVETLGATSVIIADKTGTLTENQMTLSQIEIFGQCVTVSGTGLDTSGTLQDQSGQEVIDSEQIDELLKVLVLCNNASLFIKPDGESDIVGDPTEIALLIAGAKRNIHRDQLLQSMPEVREETFSSESKAMATFHQQTESETIYVAVKGAPEIILDACTGIHSQTGITAFDTALRNEWSDKANDMAARGLRLLAVASKQVRRLDEKPYENLEFLGLIGLVDPPRPGIKEAIQQCHTAGINIIMVTGDHPATAVQVGDNLGLVQSHLESSVDSRTGSRQVVDLRAWPKQEDLSSRTELLQTSIFARATPQQKQQLIQLHQNQGHIVAMTGDGINDAPALKLADIGIAMGKRGTQVAKDAAAMILQDDEFSSIVVAIKQGRVIYNNILKFVIYLLSCNLSEILIIGFATMLNAPLPLLPLQILFLNLVTDVFPALALGVSKGASNILEQAPRKTTQSFLHRQHWLLIVVYGVLMSGIVLAAMSVAARALDYSASQVVTIAFLTLAFAQLWHVFNLREDTGQWIKNEISTNRWIWAALVLCVLLILLAVYMPLFSTVLKISPPDGRGWLLVMVFSLSTLLIGPVFRTIVQKITAVSKQI